MRSQDAEVDVPPVVPAGARREIRPRDETRRCCGDTRRLHALFTSGSSRRRSSRRGRRASASSPQAGRRRAAAEPRPFTRPSGEQVRRRADGAARPGVGGRGGERHPSNCSQLPLLPPSNRRRRALAFHRRMSTACPPSCSTWWPMARAGSGCTSWAAGSRSRSSSGSPRRSTPLWRRWRATRLSRYCRRSRELSRGEVYRTHRSRSGPTCECV
jgi:hypothetical protein